MSNLPELEVFLRADPLEAVAVSDPPVNVEQPIFQTVNLDGVLTGDAIGVTIQPYDADYPDIKAKVESINAEDFATAAQGALAETAIQPDDLLPYALSEDVNTGLGDKVDKVAGKQLSTEDYTTEEKTKLLGIEEGAQVNPDLSGYAPKNNATFTGSLILPNNSRIAGVEHFYQTAKPITRGDGSALVAGDRWWKVDDGTEWFWNGTYWLSEAKFRVTLPRFSTTTASVSYVAYHTPTQPIPVDYAFIESITGFLSTASQDAANNYTMQVGLYDNAGITMNFVIDTFNTFNDSILHSTNSTRRIYKKVLNQFADISTPAPLASNKTLLGSVFKVNGTSQGLNASFVLSIREVYP